MIVVQAERPEDRVAVLRVSQLAFGRPDEGTLVEALRDALHGAVISLVAVEKDEVVGHIFFSPVSIESKESITAALALGPMAVLPEFQRRGIGSELVRSGLAECKERGQLVVVVLGHPEFYPRFGFTPAKGKGLRCEYAVPDEVFMVTELEPDALQLQGVEGMVKYRPEFGSV